MFLSLLLRGTLLLLLAGRHSLAQEWYTQEDFATENYATNVVQDPQASFLEKRDAENLANDSNAVHIADYYAPNVRQKRDIDNDDKERNGDVTDHTSSDVTNHAPNDVTDHAPSGVTDHAISDITDHLNDVSDEHYESNDEFRSLETNMTSTETNDTYDAGGWNQGSDVDNNTMHGGFNDSDTTSSMLDDAEQSGDAMDEREEPTDEDYKERSETKSGGDEAIQDGEEKHSSQEDDRHASQMNKFEDSKKKGQGNAAEAEDIEETSEEEEGSGEFPKERFLSDEDEDEQPVKRQNLGMKIISVTSCQTRITVGAFFIKNNPGALNENILLRVSERRFLRHKCPFCPTQGGSLHFQQFRALVV